MTGPSVYLLTVNKGLDSGYYSFTSMAASSGQHSLHDVQILQKRGKGQIIKEAVQLLRKRNLPIDIIIDDYNCKVWANSEKVVTVLERKFIVMRHSARLRADITIDMITGSISPFDDPLYQNDFYVPTDQENVIIDFVKKQSGLPYPNKQHTITELEDTYWVSVNDDTSFRKFYVNKSTGEESGVLEGSYVKSPLANSHVNDNVLKEIKE